MNNETRLQSTIRFAREQVEIAVELKDYSTYMYACGIVSALFLMSQIDQKQFHDLRVEMRTNYWDYWDNVHL